MNDKILILLSPGDLQGYAVAKALKLKRANPVLWHTADFPTRSGESIGFDEAGCTVHVENLEINFSGEEVRTVWRRRPAHALDESLLHPADLAFAQLECAIFRRSFLSTILPRAFWVNPHDAAISAGRKILQHRVAVEVGFKTPVTLYSNDPHRIHAFIGKCGGRVAYKPMQSHAWHIGDNLIFTYTAILAESDLVSDDLLRATPGIYQEIIPKAYELRITAMGEHLFPTKVNSQETTSGKLDWRKAGTSLELESCTLPESVQSACLALMRRLGLVFGCIDLIVTPSGEHVFLEVNEMGEFLFLEQKTGAPLLDAFAEFLLQGRPDFTWSQESATVRITDVLEAASERSVNSFDDHVAAPESGVREGS